MYFSTDRYFFIKEHFFSHKKPIVNRFFVLMLCFFLYSFSYQTAAETLYLNQAVQKALKQHPSLAVYQDRIKRAQGLIAQSRVGTRKSINFDINNSFGTGNLSGLDRAETTLGVTWVLEDNILNAREKRARENKSLLELKNDLKRLDIASDTATRFLTALLYQEKLKIAQQWKNNASRMYHHIIKRVNAGKSPVADQYRAKAELSLSELELEDIEHEIEAAYVQLSALWGSSTPSFNRLAGNATQLGALPSFEKLKAQLDNNPDLGVFLTQDRIAQSEVNLAKAESKNRWQFNTGVRHFAATDDIGLVAGFSVSLGSEKRSKGKLSALNSSISANRNEAAAFRIQLEADIFELYQSYKHAMHVIDALSTKTIPNIESALSETQKAYDLGRSDFQEWTLIQQELLKNKVRLLEAYHLAHINRIEIERILGLSINSLMNEKN